ncbi:MAG TPA: hypothetical protein VN800_01050, partial [Candidatus Acidoferrales bacterium]|nr:hypothetical protein [Candidatus Acidoferrales bacterium]
MPVTSEVEQLGTAEAEASAIQAGTSATEAEASATEAEASAIGAAVPVVEPEVQRVPPYGELTPVDLPVAPPTSDEPAVVTQRPADGPPEPGGSTPLVAPRPAFTGAARALTDARLAHVHLALGMFGLARAELETLAGRGWLDVPALADLAEVRWRTGDLVGAGEAADAHLQAGGEELVALCVAAEAAAAAGRAADARNLAARVLARGRNRL